MAETEDLFSELIGEDVVIDTVSPYVFLGRLARADSQFVELLDADAHDLRDSESITREIYVSNSHRFGIRRNRKRVLLSRREIVALARFADVVED